MQQNLFPENNVALSENSSLPVRINKGKTIISKEQQSFNRLTARIKSLQEKIKKDTDFLTVLNTYYHKNVTPEVIKLGEEKIKLSHLLHEKRKAEKLSVHQNGKLDQLIFQLLDDAFSVIEPDEKIKELFARYNGASYEEEMDAQQDNTAELFSSMFFEQTGIKIDPEELKKTHPDFEKLDDSIKEQFNNGSKKNQRKTKKQLEKEEIEKQKEEVKNKSLRTIYLSLARILHPDRELDENLRVEKEEYMKIVTTAYNNKDLMELLRLEILWVSDHKKLLENTPADTLKIYIQLLKDQVKDLEYESLMVVENPAYSNVAGYLFLNQSTAFASIDHNTQGYIDTHNKYADAIIALEKNNRNRSIIVKCIEDFYEEVDDDFPDFLSEAFDNFEKNSKRGNH
ncbi:MAG: hypothetical protein ABIO55_06705 [Ginsengibacter sp.]